MSNILTKLKDLKHDPKGGAVSRGEHEALKSRLLSRIAAEEPMRIAQPSYFSWYIQTLISKPVTVGTAAFAIFAGSLTTVNAAAGSLPGDTLYTVKRMTEQAQLKLASLDRRAVLHTEFAERRLAEASELRSSGNPANISLAKEAMVAYASELSQASADLKELQGAVDSTQAMSVVSDVTENIEAMKDALDGTVAVSESPDAALEALEAKQAATATQDVATTVAVDVHESSGDAHSDQELKEMFKRELGSIEARQTFDEHRLEVIGSTVLLNEKFEDVPVPGSDDLKRMTYVITQTRLQIPEAMNDFAAGGYRSAFATLSGIDAELLALEAQVADIEFLITQTLALPDPEPVRDAQEEVVETEAEVPPPSGTEGTPPAE